ncbi:MAG: VWA domain-containing protein, partial [Pseudomonadota bacterium]|nr:VWA domain-containing protein [Pseudomonadota bacterium]
MTRLPTALAVMALLASPLTAQERPAAILVLDGSGSMWGQIDGTAKITIAQDVIGGLMTTLPADLDLGLTVYGHRRKGDCADIETLVMPGPDTRGAITGAVNGIKPKGKTPMADAVVAAAKALRHTEEAATVILVSDGIETCVPDVCAVARALEETGVDFTAHVVGFGVDDPETLAQFQCMADSTGGQFLSAANAAQLSAALTEVAVVEPTPEPAPLPGSLIYSVAEKHGEASRRVDVEWSLLNEDGEQMITAYHVDFGEQDLPEGIYTLTVTRVSDGTRQEKQVVIRPNARTEAHFEFEAPLPQVTLLAPQTAAAGATISVDWTGPDAAQDYLDTAPVGAEARTYLTYTYTERGNPTALRVPAQPGDYEIRYVLGDGAQILARVPLTVTSAEFALEAPATALAGATIDVSWTGSGYDEDYLSIASAGTAPNRYEAYTYVRKGNPAPLLMPTEPGQYEIRYITGQDTSIAVTRLIEVTAL